MSGQLEQLPLNNLILAIDDDAMMRLMLHDILEREGFEVLTASNSHEGIDIIKSRHPDMVLLDVMMPEINGFDCLLAIRAIPGMALLPIVMITGADDVDSINRSFQLSATDFIAKPISWPTLPHRLRYLLRASAAFRQLASSEADLRSAQQIARLGSWEWSVEDDKMRWSDEVFKVLDVNPNAFRCRRQDLYNAISKIDADQLHQIMESCLKNKHNFHLQFHIRHAKAADSVVLLRGEPIIDGNIVTRVKGTIQDITERLHIEEQIHLLSYYDPLTGLPNRNQFKEILGQALAYCNRFNTTLSTLFISIDRFKRINETLGPNVGDSILKIFSERLVSVVRDCDYVAVNAEYNLREKAVSRLGGNEFTVLLNQVQDTRDSVKIAERIIRIMGQSFNIEAHEIFLGINIGIAIYPGDGIDEDSLIQNGEFAMSHARGLGQNTYQFFSKSLNVAAFQQLSMENTLRRAIERDELRLFYQPKIDMRHKRVVGCEALIRWQHPELGLVPPSKFIPIAEASGLITEISNWVLETACSQLRRWQLQDLPPLVVAVNVSANHFRQGSFVRQIQQLLSRLELAPQHLKLELTESILLEGIENALLTLRELRAFGVHISIDDFGTGYSSLAYLKKLPISELKIDRSFIRDIPHNEEDMAITKAILALAKSLSLEVVAEGVEHEEQVAFLIQHGCDTAQGFLYSKPVAPDEFAAYIKQFASAEKNYAD